MFDWGKSWRKKLGKSGEERGANCNCVMIHSRQATAADPSPLSSFLHYNALTHQNNPGFHPASARLRGAELIFLCHIIFLVVVVAIVFYWYYYYLWL